MAQAWYLYPRIDLYGSPDPYGGFPKPDSNIQCPDGTPITALLAGTVSGINAPGGGMPDWGAVITIRLDTPVNSIATHTAYLHMSGIASGLTIGTHITAGTLVGWSGGAGAAGVQKVPLGFALYNGDYYGYGASWSVYDGSPALNPVPLLNSFASGSQKVPPPSGTGGTTPPVTTPPTGGTTPIAPITSSVSIILSPTADVTQLLATLDNLMIVNNPFDIQATPTIGGSTIPDPIQWISEVGTNAWNDTLALTLRSVFIIIGIWIVLKVFNEFIDYGALMGAVTNAIGTIGTASGGM